MKGSGQVCRFFLLLLISVSGREHCTAGVTHESRAVSVLYEQFETISYAESDLVLSSGAYHGISKKDADVLRLPFYEMKEALESLSSRTSKGGCKTGDRRDVHHSLKTGLNNRRFNSRAVGPSKPSFGLSGIGAGPFFNATTEDAQVNPFSTALHSKKSTSCDAQPLLRISESAS